MLTRVLESEVMDSADEARDYDAMDHRELNRRFVGDFVAELLKAEGRKQKAEEAETIEVLDLGSGTAQIPIELCRQIEKARVVAVDAAESMIELARRNTEMAGLADRIALLQGDAKKLGVPDKHFDCVMSNSIVHHLAEPLECLREAVRAVRPGGLLFFRDLVRPDDETTLQRLVDLYAPPADGSPAADHQRAMLAASLWAALTLDEIRALVGQLDFPPESVQITSDRHWTWVERK